MPIPVSATLSDRAPSASTVAASVIMPPDGVNLIEFDRRLSRTCLIRRLSARSPGRSGAGRAGALGDDANGIAQDGFGPAVLLVQFILARFDLGQVEQIVDDAQEQRA